MEYPLDASNLYRLPKQAPGNHTVIVNAIDSAGNSSSVSLDYTIQAISGRSWSFPIRSGLHTVMSITKD